MHCLKLFTRRDAGSKPVSSSFAGGRPTTVGNGHRAIDVLSARMEMNPAKSPSSLTCDVVHAPKACADSSDVASMEVTMNKTVCPRQSTCSAAW